MFNSNVVYNNNAGTQGPKPHVFSQDQLSQIAQLDQTKLNTMLVLNINNRTMCMMPL